MPHACCSAELMPAVSSLSDLQTYESGIPKRMLTVREKERNHANSMTRPSLAPTVQYTVL